MMWKIFILSVCVMGVALGDSAPAFIWGSSSAPRPSLQTLSQDEFADILEPNLKDSMVVAFLEPELSNSDFACSKVKTEDSCYSNLKGVTPKTYYGSVQNPTEALRQISANREFATIDDAGVLENEISYEAGKVVFVSFEAPTEAIDRSELLEFHDAAISKVYNKLAKEGTITAVYTRTQSTDIGKTRRRRATGDEPAQKSGFVFRSTNVFLLYYTSLALQTTDTTVTTTPIDIQSMTIDDQTDTSFNATLKGATNTITFKISLSEGYFIMSDLKLNGESYFILPSINSLTDFSYYCGNQELPSVLNNNKVILWDNLQMQAPFNKETSDKFVFGDPWYCVGFFTPGILAGLFVVIILLAIVAVGICWMMDINTMDRFDDPKGKTITINVSE